MTQVDLQIGYKIRTKRRKLGFTQADLAKKILISPSYLNLIESGKRKVNVDLLLKLFLFFYLPPTQSLPDLL